MTQYPEEVIAAYRKLCAAIEKASGAPYMLKGVKTYVHPRSRSAFKAAQTRASKVFSRACYKAGWSDAQAVANDLSKIEG